MLDPGSARRAATTAFRTGAARRPCHRATAGAAVLAAAAMAAHTGIALAQQHIARPPPLIIVPPAAEAREPIRIDLVSVRATVAGGIASTDVEIVVSNPNDRQLEGRVQFPLLEGQTVTGFALDVAGRLRSAVPVPKAEGRRIFEDVRRQRVDPGLLEVTQGNAYSLRVYPIPAHGTRRVRLEIAQTLGRVGEQHEYRLPLAFGQKIGRLDVQVDVARADRARTVATLGALPLAFEGNAAGGVRARLVAEAVDAAGVLTVRYAAAANAFAITSDDRGRTHFHAEFPADATLRTAVARPHPERVAIVWDASASGRDRDHAAELALLEAWFRHVRSTRVSLHVVRDVASAPLAFEVREGRWDALRAQLEQLTYDGASSREFWSRARDADLALAFTDALLNYGEGAIVAPAVPTFAVLAAPRADATALRGLAERSGGALVDLVGRDPVAAATTLLSATPHLVRADGVGTRDTVFQSPQAVDGRYAIAGELTAPRADLRLTFADARGRTFERTLRIERGATADSASPPLATRTWARLRLAALALDEITNAATIERLGMQHRLPTSRTSLLVLEDAADYARYGIEPPADDASLVAAVARLRTEQRAAATRDREAQLAHVRREFRERATWWSKRHPKDEPRAKIAGGSALESVVVSGMRQEAAASADMSERRMAMPDRALRERIDAVAAAAPVAADAAKSSGDTAPTATIRLRAWEPDSTYARRMRAAADARAAYAIYLDERGDYERSTAFFLDAADILGTKGDATLAARVLSNLAEMDLEDRQILRILGYRLLQAKLPRLARPVFERVRDLAPDEPQSWRDLGLAHAALAETQPAVDALWHVVETPWHDRFPSIEVVALGELNAIVARARADGHTVDTSRIPDDLQRNLPVALRVVLTWDADDTDIDLWVTDPNGEKAFYGHRLTYQGGAMSRDFTGGYGPEEFLLREAKRGTYRVQAQFYGHRQQVVAPATTLMLAFYTGFGTPEQQVQSTILRLAERSEVIEVGEFEVR